MPLNGYINIDLFLHMYIFSQILIGILYGEKMNVLLKRIMLELIHLSLVFSVGSWTCGTLYHCLFVRQQLLLVLKKEWGSFLIWKCLRFFSYSYSYLIDCFFVHISVCIFTVLIVCLLKLVFIIWISFKRCSVFYGVFDSFRTVRKAMPFFL